MGETKGSSWIANNRAVPTLILAVMLLVFAIIGVAVYERNTWKTPLHVEELLTSSAIHTHLSVLQNIATSVGGGKRDPKSGGYYNSVEYLFSLLSASTDLLVYKQPFIINYTSLARPGAMRVVHPLSSSLTYNVDFLEMMFTGGGFVQSTLTVVNNLGCAEADYVAFPKGHIALIMRGQCTFSSKVNHAIKAGASAVLVYNDGANDSRMGLMSIGIGKPAPIPCLFLTFKAGQTLADYPIPPVVAIDLMVEYSPIETWNLIAETRLGSDTNVIVMGSHLDSVPSGAGINDNGSGSAVLLEIALQLHNSGLYSALRNKIRFAWWSAEELGLLGSSYYVDDLANKTKLDTILCNYNVDMIGSPNYIRAIYDGRNAELESIRAGSAVIQNIAEWYFDKRGLTHTTRPFDGRSDYGPFIERGIAAGGLFTGAEEIKSVDDRTLFGGVANVALDPCYHQPCDTLDNINMEVTTQMGQAAAHVMEVIARDGNARKTLYPNGQTLTRSLSHSLYRGKEM